MISFEMANALKNAGLQWKYSQSDCSYHLISTSLDNYNSGNYTGIITHSYKYPGNKFVYSGKWGFGFSLEDEDAEDEIKRMVKHNVFAPRLDQMLVEIEKLDYMWKISSYRNIEYHVEVWQKDNVKNSIRVSGCSLDNTVAEGLLWILNSNNKSQ